MDAISQGDKRQAFLEGLFEKALREKLTRGETYLCLQGTLASMLAETLPTMQGDLAAMPEGVEKENAAQFVEVGQSLQREMLSLVDHAMAEQSRIVVVGSFGLGSVR